MAKFLLILMIVIIPAAPAGAQESDDGSLEKLRPEIRARFVEILRNQLQDAYSSRLAGVVERDGVVCGLINAKNMAGAYIGRAPFAADLNSDFFMTGQRTPVGASTVEATAHFENMKRGMEMCRKAIAP